MSASKICFSSCALLPLLCCVALLVPSPRAALPTQKCDGNVERAVDWLFSHADDPVVEDEPAGAQQPASSAPPGVYR
jgi:hypothetical protein